MLPVCVCPFQLLNQQTNLHKTWYVCSATEGHSDLIILDFPAPLNKSTEVMYGNIFENYATFIHVFSKNTK
jgi:hypothetical protein